MRAVSDVGETARWWAPGDRERVRCHLCAHRCRVRPGRAGICRVRVNRGGAMRTLVHGRLVSAGIDPIEKKPLGHVHPGSRSFSVATVGCNLRCRFCQNASISQWRGDGHRAPPGQVTTPEDLVRAAERGGCRTIAFTYTEPTLGLEFAERTGALARRRGIDAVFVTNGFMTPETVGVLGGFLAAANVDLKAFRESTYRRVCGARLAPVLESIAGLVAAGVWVEVTTLVVPRMNDDPRELADIADFIAGVDPRIPWHVSAFHPTYRMTDRPRTPPEALRRARDLGLAAGLRYVYLGNVPGDPAESTFCHRCSRRLIHRVGTALAGVDLDGDRCPGCGEVLPGVGIAGARAGPGEGGGPWSALLRRWR